MHISLMCSTWGIVRSSSKSKDDFEITFHLPQCKLSSPISEFLAHSRNL